MKGCPSADRSSLSGIDSVIPICARILGYGVAGNNKDCDDENLRLGGKRSLPTHLSGLNLSTQQAQSPIKVTLAPGAEAFPDDDSDDEEVNAHNQTADDSVESRILRSSFKLASKSTAITYIRQTEEISRYMLLYPSIESQPLFATIRSFEDADHCLIVRAHPYRTDSVRYALNFHSDAVLRPKGNGWEAPKILEIENIDCRAKVAEEAYLASIKRVGSEDVIKALWRYWHSLETGNGMPGDREDGDMGKVGWQECKDIVGFGYGNPAENSAWTEGSH